MPVKRSGWDLDNASVLSLEVVVMAWFLAFSRLVPVPTRLNLAGLTFWTAAFLAAKLDLRKGFYRGVLLV